MALIVTGAPSATVVSGFAYCEAPEGVTGTFTLNWSEAITSCACAVYEMYNLAPASDFWWAAGEATGTGALAAGASNWGHQVWEIGASSNVGGETCTWTSQTANRDGFLQEMYDADSLELGYSGALAVYEPPRAVNVGMSASWSAAGNGDMVTVAFGLERTNRVW